MGQHITLKADTAEGPMLLRPYTPVSDNDQRGLVDFVIKVLARRACDCSRMCCMNCSTASETSAQTCEATAKREQALAL